MSARLVIIPASVQELENSFSPCPQYAWVKEIDLLRQAGVAGVEKKA